jgi:hypothetical protein
MTGELEGQMPPCASQADVSLRVLLAGDCFYGYDIPTVGLKPLSHACTPLVVPGAPSPSHTPTTLCACTPPRHRSSALGSVNSPPADPEGPQV